jgi:glycosyltransferase involved in cell wall biosynthesis
MMNNQLQTVAFLWPGLPDYGARLIKAFNAHQKFNVHVIATPPSVPIAGMEQSLGQKVHWIPEDDAGLTWKQLGLDVPHYLFQGGWAQASIRGLAQQARHHGARVTLMNDQNWTGGFRQTVVDHLRFRFMQRKKFDGALTPGASGARYCRTIGFEENAIATGLYGADPLIFNGGQSLAQRPKTFIFVGQLIHRKNITALVRAFINLAADYPDWLLRIVGNGALSEQLPRHAQIKVEGFLQPHALANRLRESRCLVLPSHEEHWGLVVHEATSCGCALALSRAVGSADDLADADNAVIFNPGDERAIEQALRGIASWHGDAWQRAEAKSRALAEKFGPVVFAQSALSLIERSASCG